MHFYLDYDAINTSLMYYATEPAHSRLVITRLASYSTQSGHHRNQCHMFQEQLSSVIKYRKFGTKKMAIAWWNWHLWLWQFWRSPIGPSLSFTIIITSVPCDSFICKYTSSLNVYWEVHYAGFCHCINYSEDKSPRTLPLVNFCMTLAVYYIHTF